MLEFGNMIDLKCKKVVSGMLETKMIKIENEIKENVNGENMKKKAAVKSSAGG
jgi:hypothetical protein